MPHVHLIWLRVHAMSSSLADGFFLSEPLFEQRQVLTFAVFQSA